MLEADATPLRSLPLAETITRLHAAGRDELLAFVDALLDHARETEPVLRALIPEDDRRQRVAREVDAILDRWPDVGARPSLFGVPVGVKDIVAVDGLPTRAGSALPAEAFEMPEATIVRRLRDAGAIVFAKTVTAEFASMSPGGTTNPHNPRHTPGGSSSGSAAGVAAGYYPLAIGTQTGGSMIRPASFCGIVGLKPSYGRIPTEGVLAHASSVDTLGLFAQDVAGVTVAAGAVLDGWRGSETRDTDSIRLAVPDGPYLALASPEGRQAFEETLTRLARTGIEVLRVSFLDDIEEILDRHGMLMDAEFAAEHEERFRRWGPLFSGGAAEQVDRGRRVSADQLASALAGRADFRARVHAFLEDVGADALIAPSALGPAPDGLRSTGDPKMNAPWTHAGVPAISLPAGSVEGLPVGLQAIGRFGGDEELLGVAAALERLVLPD
ncbi:MAG: amidase [Dehalococcoidia bacterium]|nr:amidase [Dehalococcoidia bacterium]